MNKFVKIPQSAKIKVHWDDKSENYSRENKIKIRNDFAKKYGVDKNNINIIFRPFKINSKGELIEIKGASVENIMDISYQRSLMVEWFNREQKTVDIDRLMKLDDKVNNSLNIDLNQKAHRSWNLKWLTLNNFLCYGPTQNYVSFSKLTGLNIVSSEPKNQGGKTTFSVDALKFLFFGRTTKTDKNEQIFNSYTNENELKVRGMIEFDGKEIIIERRMTRTAKKEGGWAVKNFLNYYELLPDGDEVLLNDEDSKASTTTIQNTIGSEKDFDITILATGGNLEDLIDSTPTESGKLLTKFIGLEIIELKEKSAREMSNEFSKTKTSNMYDVVTLFDEINDAKDKIELLDVALENQNFVLLNLNEKIKNLNESKDIKLSSKKSVNETISVLNPQTLESKLSKIELSGKNKNVEISELKVEIESLVKIDYDESKYFNLIETRSSTNNTLSNLISEKDRIVKLISDLESGELCPTCKRPLEDVDHSNEILDNKNLLNIKNSEITKIGDDLIVINKNIESLNTNKLLVDRRMRLENLLSKSELELLQLKNEYVEQKKLLNEYNSNKDAIEFNLDVDLSVTKLKSDIQIEEYNKSELLKKLNEIENLLRDKKLLIVNNEGLIKKIKDEEEIDKIFKVYIEMVGKKGISKLVLRSVLPIINSELYRLLEDACDFNIELIINSKNEVEYLLEKDEIIKPLKSGSGLERTIASLALRCVLAKMSHLPMPNFITFDEVLGKLADVNIEKLKPMFEKIRDMYEIVFLITHNDIVKDWGDNFISITKTDNISEIHVK